MGQSRTLDTKWTELVNKKIDDLERNRVLEKVCEEKHGNVEETAKEAKNIALASKKQAGMPHICVKEDVLEDLDGWKKWLRAGVFSLAFVVILGVAGWYSQRSEIDSHLTKQGENLKRLETSVKEVKETQKAYMAKLETKDKVEREESRERLTEIKGIIVEAIKEAKERKPNKNRKRD
jgi:hypothetical protein